MARSRFDRFRQPRPCAVCKALTTNRDEICPKCRKESDAEIEHSDGHTSPVAGCKFCTSPKPEGF